MLFTQAFSVMGSMTAQMAGMKLTKPVDLIMVFYTNWLFRGCKYESQKKAKWRFCLDLAQIQCILGPQINTRVYIGFIMDVRFAEHLFLQR